MTVAELIEELSKHPAHHTVVMETYEQDLESGGMSTGWSFVGEVEGQSNVGDIGSIVRIIAEADHG